jgi:hypothetical protein
MTEKIPARLLLHPVDFLALGFGSWRRARQGRSLPYRSTC